jgi:hypothetical protein
MKTSEMIQNGVDGKSIGLCMASVFLKVMSDVTLSDVATFSATLAAVTTVAYNLQRMYKESKKSD